MGRLLAIFCGILSVAIVVGQLTLSLEDVPLSLFPLLFQKDQGFWSTQVYCSLPLTYLLGVAYWSVFRLKFSANYGLYPQHGTDSCSLLWCAVTLGRIVAPLCYNCVLLIHVPGTAYAALMGTMSEAPLLGGSFNVIAPMLIGTFMVCHALNIYPRFVRLLNLDILEVQWGQTAPAEHGDLP